MTPVAVAVAVAAAAAATAEAPSQRAQESLKVNGPPPQAGLVSVAATGTAWQLLASSALSCTFGAFKLILHTCRESSLDRAGRWCERAVPVLSHRLSCSITVLRRAPTLTVSQSPSTRYPCCDQHRLEFWLQ